MMTRRFLVLGAFAIILMILGSTAHRALAYGEVEALSALHSAELEPVVRRTIEVERDNGASIFRGSLEYFKVFSYRPGDATVFVVSRYESRFKDGRLHSSGKAGGMLHFVSGTDGWALVLDSASHPVWDSGGSMDGDVWPPYR